MKSDWAHQSDQIKSDKIRRGSNQNDQKESEGGEMIKDVTDLIIYQKALALLEPLYLLVEKFPRNEFELRQQVTSSAKSVSALIAEGFAKKSSAKEFKHYLNMALGSSDETSTHLRQVQVIPICKSLSSEAQKLIDEYVVLSKQINSTKTKWQRFF